MSKQTTANAVSATQNDLLGLARELGLTALNKQEQRLIHLLRFTSFHGRNLVLETAMAMRCTYPWRDHAGSMPDNTKSLHLGDDQFWNPSEDM